MAPIDDADCRAGSTREPQPLDLGIARGVWGERIFIESVGAGLIPAGIAAAKAQPDEPARVRPPRSPTDAVRIVSRRAGPLRAATVDDHARRTGDDRRVPSGGSAQHAVDRAQSRPVGRGQSHATDSSRSSIATEQHRDVLDEYLVHRIEGRRASAVADAAPRAPSRDSRLGRRARGRPASARQTLRNGIDDHRTGRAPVSSGPSSCALNVAGPSDERAGIQPGDDAYEGWPTWAASAPRPTRRPRVAPDRPAWRGATRIPPRTRARDRAS